MDSIQIDSINSQIVSLKSYINNILSNPIVPAEDILPLCEKLDDLVAEYLKFLQKINGQLLNEIYN